MLTRWGLNIVMQNVKYGLQFVVANHELLNYFFIRLKGSGIKFPDVMVFYSTHYLGFLNLSQFCRLLRGI